MKKLHLSLLVLPALMGCLTLPSPAQTPAPAAPPASAAPASSDAAAPAPEAVDPAKAAEIQKMLELTGTTKILQHAVEQIVGTFKEKNPNLSDAFWAGASKDVDAQAPITQLIPLYNKYYSTQDLKDVNTFYATPAGQRLLAVTPQLTTECIRILQEWGQVSAAKIQADIEKEKARIAAAPAPAAGGTAAPAPSAPAAPAPGAQVPTPQ